VLKLLFVIVISFKLRAMNIFVELKLRDACFSLKIQFAYVAFRKWVSGVDLMKAASC